jgi:signal transduction histidine kinase
VRLTFRATGQPLVSGDADQLCKALECVIDNAVRAHSKEGVVSIEVGLKDDFAIVLVRDLGVGIPAEDHERIFLPLETTRAPGLGLGLPIARQTAEAHGGRLFVAASEVGRGTTFALELPRLRVGS